MPHDKYELRLNRHGIAAIATLSFSPTINSFMATTPLAAGSVQDLSGSDPEAPSQQALEESPSLGSEEMEAETDAFQCGRCRQRKTRYFQRQTRSANEPMTVNFCDVCIFSLPFTAFYGLVFVDQVLMNP
ncbi:hypothetical protein JB92DRAFT_3034168 [Gautieria morchelliformis]|nr:hypothetical protein JB92DRAFT_3034168 [Gautieria morchelliformis]